jgi:hypothetical protein
VVAAGAAAGAAAGVDRAGAGEASVSYVRSAPERGGRTARAAVTSHLGRARECFREFHARAPSAIVRACVRRDVPGVLVQLGTLRGLIYSADRGDGGRRSYIHFMESAPMLACDPDGRRLFIVGGRYRVTRRGIEG